MSILIDCDVCVARGHGCQDCVVTVLLGPPPEASLDADGQRALDVLADSGLVPRLRMVEPVASWIEGDEPQVRHPTSEAERLGRFGACRGHA